MPLSKQRNKERMQKIRRLGVKHIMTSADIRAMRAAGIDPEYIDDEVGKVSSRVYYALLRDRDAIKAHLTWLQDNLKSGRIVLKAEVIE